MKKTGLSRRVLAMMLIIVMTVQLIPANVFAFGELLAKDTKINVETIDESDFIKWPIKIYDYVNDGMLFEWHDTPMTGFLGDGHSDIGIVTAPYGGGTPAPTTLMGEDFTYASSLSWSSTSMESPYFWRYDANHGMGNAYQLTAVDAVDYESPYYMSITDGDGTGHNLMLSYFEDGQSTTGNMRYVVLAYRSKNLDRRHLSLSLSSQTWDDGNFNRVYLASAQYPEAYKEFDDSEEWTYMVVDMYDRMGEKNDLHFLWLTTMPSNTEDWPASGDDGRGMQDDAYLHLSHVGFFDNYMEAVNYGEACKAFDNDPGEYLRHDTTFTATNTVVTPSQSLDYIFSLYYQYEGYLTGKELEVTDGVYYGMDFTTTSKKNGNYTNAYTTNTYWTWKNGGTQTYKYTQNNIISSYAFQLDPIGVQLQSEKNGAMYVRLTADNPSRVLLSKFREDKAAQYETWIPLTSNVNYAVLVYRPNGLTAQDQYAFWAQGYEAASANATNTEATNWKYAAIVEQGASWESSGEVNKLNFGSQSQWQYVVVPLTETIGAKDSDMSQITRLARAGIYLPEMSNGQSLDLAYACYFSNAAEAEAFGQSAVSYMTSEPTITTTTSEVSWGSNRVWESGNNISLGMGYATGGGHWSGHAQGHIYAGGSNTTDAYGYDTWMIGYGTMHGSDMAYNTFRKNPVTGEYYTAKYTDSYSADYSYTGGTSNFIYRINGQDSNDGIENDGYDTSILEYDGYELLETIITGNATTGLLQGNLRTVNVNNTDYRIPVYRRETVEYIAYMLYHALRVPRRDANGDYTMAYVSGKATSKFGGVDLNGDGEIGYIDLDGDPRNGNETDENSVDLATALRHCLGISFIPGSGVGVGGEMGSYDQTLAKDEQLIGQFEDCRYSIDTAMDAAYYLLNSLFIANSYNQKQDDYYYLQMPSATIEMGERKGTAYVFDAGFTTGATADDNQVFLDDGTNDTALSFSPAVDANGKAGTGTIYLNNVTGKTYFNYSKTSTAWTTRFPFLPVTDAEGDFAGGTYSYYFWEESRIYSTAGNGYYNRCKDATDYVTSRRNYNYVIASNGEFVYDRADELFFEFEGDDDVYLFINGELVLDIGGAHAATNVYMDVNDYVDKARNVMKELEKYGYSNSMPIEEFDAMISGDTLQEYIYDPNTGRITGTKTVTNPYSADQIANFKRWCRLDLVDGQICQFDFYYMERHGWGANMRIFTNMHITDPALNIDKTAYQYGQEIEYGGVIDPTTSLEYNFALTNSGNQKLYNLTFEDKVIGVTLDPTNGLTVADDLNGIYVLDANGGTLEAKDLTATVRGYNAKGEYTEVPVTFPEVDGDGGQTALKNFLKMLDAEGTEKDFDDAEITHAGSGLWVDGTVIIHNIHYMLQPHQIEAGAVNNTVYLTATTRTDPNQAGSHTLYSDADHLIYTSGFPVHYQWAGHSIFINMDTVVKSAKKEATIDDSQLNLYLQFFNKVSGIDDIYYHICDKYGRVGGNYPYHTKFTDVAGNAGYLVNYDEPGIYTFYMLLYLKQGEIKDYAPTGINAEDIKDGEYAILRSQVYVADVEDSVFVLDYGLSTESLDVGGELFKNDYLFGPYGTLRAKLMAVSNIQPSYIDPETATSTDYNRISFTPHNIADKNIIQTPDGTFKVNLAIPEDGKLIGYDSVTGDYTLTGVGTVTVNATVPSDGNWKTPYLYYWYDDGVSGPAWPGTAMTSMGGGQYKTDIPADVTNVIINNGTGALQTSDLKITPGLESTIHVSVDDEGAIHANIETVLEHVTLHTKVPSDWKKVFVYYWDDNGENAPFPGEEVSIVDDAYFVDDNGYYTLDIPGNVTNLIISNGENKQSGNQKIYAGKEVWLEVSDDLSGTAENNDGTTTYYYDTIIKYTLSEGYVLHASVPANWKDKVYLYYWHDGMTDDEMTWPGIELKKGDFGWYTLDGLIPSDVTSVIINDDIDGTMGDGDHQTINLTVTPGLETWVMVNNKITAEGKYTARVAYGAESSTTGLTFTPQKFMDQANEMWLALTVHATSAHPSALNSLIDIHNEVQMYKKITVVPATVVYYEDTFQDINYNDEDTTSQNVFIHHGNGSGQLTQSVDQEQPYGQDATYQDSANELYSGDSLLAVQIKDTANVATFTFKGTGFEMISRTNALDAASVVARVYKSENYSKDAYDNYVKALQDYYADPTGKTEPVNPTVKILPVISQFDHGGDGGEEAINQVPSIRITDLEFGEYTVELYGMPTYIFDPNNNYAISGIKDTYLYVDGLRIFQPMGPTHDVYTDAENGAQVVEIRDLIMNAQIAVGTLVDGILSMSTGTVTWTENLTGNGFEAGNSETFESIQVDSTDDYLIKGPNNEVYMEDNGSNSSLIFYVTENAGSTTHELQIAVRALDYSKFYGTSSNQEAGAPGAQLQYGVLLSNGTYAWKNLTHLVSSTEQYYSIPYAECPKDTQGRYQIVLRAVDPESGTAALVSYTSLKLNGLTVQKVEGVGEATILYYLNGVLIRPDYYLMGTINGTEYTEANDVQTMYQFVDGRLSLTLKEPATVAIRRELKGNTLIYTGKTDLGDATSAQLYSDGNLYYMTLPAGQITLILKQTSHGSLSLTCCQHIWDSGKVTTEPNCTETGVLTYTCTECGDSKHESIPTNGKHIYSGRVCALCGDQESDFYLVGYFNGSDYNEDSYLFVDSRLVVTFDTTSYVAVKNAAGTWFMTDGWLDNAPTSATLYDCNTIETDNKLMVPGGVELTFTLQVNEDGTLTLSYKLPCTHNWNAGKVTTAPDCTNPGLKIVTCTLCGETKTEEVPAAGHSYVGGVCTVCGEIETITIYFKNTAGWTDVNIWAWNSYQNFTGGEWPGVAMTPVEGEEGLYSFTLPTTATGVIFNDGNVQTGNLTMPTGDQVYYRYDLAIWTAKDEQVDFYLVGSINGVDYGIGADSDNMGQYRFENGWLDVTFETDSYVFIKTGGNTAWFMANEYCTVEQVTLYNTSTGAGEKLFVPGGVTLTFTLVVNGDGTLTLRYAAPCTHQWDTGEITTPAGCETTGVKTYTCGLCGYTKTDTLEATGHSYVDGSCSVCGGQDPEFIDKVYLKAGSDWTQGGAWFAAWFPGAETWATMSDPYGNGYYQCVIPEGATGVVFVRMSPSATAPSWNDGEKWNQSVDLSVEANRLFVIENPWNEAYEWKATGSWTDYNATTAECQHQYDEQITTPAGCTSTGLKTLTCSKCSTSYTQEIDATGHNYVDGSCSNCGGAEPTEPVMLYLKPNSNWNEGNARFAAYFFNDSSNTWVDMTDPDGDGIYQCQAVSGYSKVIYCRMNPGTTENNWTNKWNQTGNLTVLYNGYNLCTINDGQWDCGENVTWSNHVAAFGLSLRMTRSVTNAMSAAQSIYLIGDEDNAMNLSSISDQLASDVVIEETDDFIQEEEKVIINIDGAAPVLSDDIRLNYYVTVPENAENVYMSFAFNGKENIVTASHVDATGRVYFTFAGVNPQTMGDEIDATLHATIHGVSYTDVVEDYSIVKYCARMLDRTTDPTLVTLISDLLVYGEKTQIYQGYKLDQLVTEGLELNPSTFPGLDQSDNKLSIQGQPSQDVSFTGVTLLLSSKMTLRLTVKTADPTAFTYRVSVANVEQLYTAEDLEYAGNGKYYLYFDELKATCFDEAVTATILRDGQSVGQTVTYSVNTFIYRNQNTEDVALRELLEAIYNYGVSAQNMAG